MKHFAAAALLLPSLLTNVSRRTPIVEVVELASPAVVNISTERTVLKRQYPFGSAPSLEEFFYGLSNPSYTKENVPLAIGTGVLIDPRGYVLTNEHILMKASAIKVTLSDSSSYTATVVGSDPVADVAVIRIETGNTDKPAAFPFLKPGDSSDLMVGEQVVAIGNPFGLSSTVSAGIISGLKRQLPSERQTYDDFIQTDAAINPGNSGGPLLNIKGELIGINTAVHTGNRDWQAEGIGFAIPINFAKRVMEDLIQYGRMVPAYVGFRVWKERGKVWVAHVDEEGPAFKAGLREGDQLVSCNDVPMKSESDFQSQVMRMPAKGTLRCETVRIDKRSTVSLAGADFPSNYWQKVLREVCGVQLRQVGGELMVTTVFTNQPADRVGLRPGDKLLQIDSTKLKSINDFIRLAPSIYYRSSILLVIERDGGIYYATLSL